MHILPHYNWPSNFLRDLLNHSLSDLKSHKLPFAQPSIAGPRQLIVCKGKKKQGIGQPVCEHLLMMIKHGPLLTELSPLPVLHDWRAMARVARSV